MSLPVVYCPTCGKPADPVHLDQTEEIVRYACRTPNCTTGIFLPPLPEEPEAPVPILVSPVETLCSRLEVAVKHAGSLRTALHDLAEAHKGAWQKTGVDADMFLIGLWTMEEDTAKILRRLSETLERQYVSLNAEETDP